MFGGPGLPKKKHLPPFFFAETTKTHEGGIGTGIFTFVLIVSNCQIHKNRFLDHRRKRPPLPSFLPRAQLLQRPGPLLLPLLLGYPHVLLVGHDVGQHGAAEEDHVPSPRRVFDAHLEFLKATKKKRLIRSVIFLFKGVENAFESFGERKEGRETL